MPRSKQLFLQGNKVHCIHKKTLKNCYVVEYKWSKYYNLKYKEETFLIHRDKVFPGWIDWQKSCNIESTQTTDYLPSPIKIIEFQ